MNSTRRWTTVVALSILAALFAAAGCRKTKVNPFPSSGEVAGWQKTSAPRTYPAKDLWQYIDGEAEAYIKAGVVSASTCDYKYQGELEAVVDIYTMKDSAGATTMFSTSPTKDGASVPLGDAGIAFAQSVDFRKGPYLVRIVAYDPAPGTKQELLMLAHGVEAKL